MVALKDVPAESIHPRAARKLEDVVGAVTLFPLVGGEPVLLARLVRPGEAKRRPGLPGAPREAGGVHQRR